VKVGITGGAGYIGSKLAMRLRDEGLKVKIIDNYSYSSKGVLGVLENIGVEIVEGDVLNSDDLTRFLDGLEFIYHLASIANVTECRRDIVKSYRLNVLSTYYVLDNIKKNNNILGFFFASAIAAIYGEPEYLPVDENHPVKVVHDYGVLKRSAELFCQSYYRRYGVPIIIGRQANVYGPSIGMKFDSVVHIFISNVIEGDNITILGSGEQRRNFIFIDDLINGYYHILKKAKEGEDIFGEIYNLAGEEATVNDVAQRVMELGRNMLGKKVNLEYKEGQQEAMSIDLRVSIEKAKKALGFQPMYSLGEGLRATIDYIISTQGKAV
jgi:UDP-glucose 4-epimerase